MAHTFIPSPYQMHAAQWAVSHQEAGLFADPGLGKTSVTLMAFDTLVKTGICKRMLVIAPLFVAETTWPDEILGWKEFNHLTFLVLRGDMKEELLQNSEHRIWIVNYESLVWLFGATRQLVKKHNGEEVYGPWKIDKARIKSLGIDMLVFDELTRLKSTDSNVHKLVRAVLPYIPRRLGLTGSPASEGLEQLFGQMYMLDEGECLGQYITHFRNQFFMADPNVDPHSRGASHHRVPAPGAEERIYKAIAPKVLRLAALDHIELPEVVYNARKFKLTDKSRAIYDKMLREMVLELPEGTITAANAAVLANKAQQITSGVVYRGLVDPITGEPTDPKDKQIFIHDEKMDAYRALDAEVAENQMLVVYNYKHELERLMKHHGKDAVALTDKVNVAEVIALWNSGKLKRLLVHPKSAAHGLNLQKSAAHHLCFFTTPWSNEQFTQVIARLVRRGSKAVTVFIYQLIAIGTIDSRVARDKITKGNKQEEMFAWLKEFAGR